MSSLLSGINRASRAASGRPPYATACFFFPTCLMAHTARSRRMNSGIMNTAVRSLCLSARRGCAAAARLPVRAPRESTLFRNNNDPCERNCGEGYIRVPYSSLEVGVEVELWVVEGVVKVEGRSDLLFKIHLDKSVNLTFARPLVMIKYVSGPRKDLVKIDSDENFTARQSCARQFRTHSLMLLPEPNCGIMDGTDDGLLLTICLYMINSSNHFIFFPNFYFRSCAPCYKISMILFFMTRTKKRSK